jgi:hypothetical protein
MKDALILLCATLGLVLGIVGFLTVIPPGGGAPDEPLAALYHALGLFVLNPSPRGLPAGEPAWAVTALWAAHFLAPLTLASVAIDAARSFLSRRERSYRFREGHTIVCGLGRTALLCVEEIVAASGPRAVVVVELHRDNPNLPRLRELSVAVVHGSMTDEAVLERAGIRGARRFLALAPDDLLNLNSATAARRHARAEGFAVYVQILDAKLMQNLPESLAREMRFLNTHEIAADALIRDRRLTRGYEDAYVVAGFGNFGRMTLKALLRDDEARHDRFFVIDEAAEQKLRAFLDTFGFEGRDVRAVKGDLHDPACWEAIRADLAERPVKEEGGPPREPLVLVCTDHDVSNLSLALSIRRRYFTSAAIYCRLFGEVAFEEDMTRGHRIETYRVADLLRKNLPQDLFGKAIGG